MKTVALIALLALITYLIYSTIKAKETPNSISETAYITSPKIFAGFMGALAGTLAPILLETASDTSKWSAFLTVVGLLMVHLTPKYKTENGLMHYIGGILAGISSQILVATNMPQMLYTWALFPILYFANKENWVLWAELICTANIFGFIASALV